MRKILLFVFVLFLVLQISLVLAAEQINVSYFYSPTCTHCKNVLDSGVLGRVGGVENVNLTKYNILDNQDLFLEVTRNLSAPQGVPLVVISSSEGSQFLSGDSPIINQLEDIVNGDVTSGQNWFQRLEVYLEDKFMDNVDTENGRLSFFGVLILILIALIDAINPCAFGVLLFLMAGLLSIGSARRARRAGLIYSFVIFIAYFSAGILIGKALTSFQSYVNPILLFVGLLVLIGGLIEIKDFFWYGKGFSLKIPVSAKPRIEQLIHKGTLPAILVLGFLVALVELPCTGGVYLVILSIMARNNIFGLGYLALYNLIFVLPLIIITLLISSGRNVDSIKHWVENNKRLMRLVTGLIMILLAIYLVFSVI